MGFSLCRTQVNRRSPTAPFFGYSTTFICYNVIARLEDRATLESDLSAEAGERRRGRPSLACPFYPVDALPRSRSMRMLFVDLGSYS